MFLGATIIACVIFFLLNVFSSLLLETGDQTELGVILEAIVKTGVFGVLFHYLHNWIAKLFKWYRIDEPDKKHTFDRNPALDQVRDGEV